MSPHDPIPDDVAALLSAHALGALEPAAVEAERLIASSEVPRRVRDALATAAAIALAAADADPAAACASGSSTPSAPSGRTPERVPTVLLVDDDRALRKLLRAYLQEEAITVVEAGSGEEALALAARAAPDLVLLDVRLPGIDGFEVLRRLEAAERAVPVILVTSLEDELDQLVAYRLGAVDFVVKPVSPKLLAAKVKAFARHAASRAGGARRTACGPLVVEATPTGRSSARWRCR
ncbi:MAG: response regulator [Thermoleophilia bacterium]